MNVVEQAKMKYADFKRGQEEKKRQAEIARAEAKVAADTKRLGPEGVLAREEAQRKEEVKLAIREGKKLARMEYEAKLKPQPKKMSTLEKLRNDAINRVRNARQPAPIRPQYAQQYQQPQQRQMPQLQTRQFGGMGGGMQIAGVTTRLQPAQNRPQARGPQIGFFGGNSRVQIQTTRRLTYGRGLR